MYLPLATYRIQLSQKFTFNDLMEHIAYFKELGVSTLYLSPILQAQPGSTHGYDVTDYRQINSELGGLNDFKQLSALLKKHGMGLCLDIVPNHMAATEYNLFWQDVVKNRQESPFSSLFDIKWHLSTLEKIRYRRFFDINELVCLNGESKKKFQETHQLVLQLIKEDLIQGLRIDHLDGLRKPIKYLKILNSAIKKPFYIIAEKILGFDETLNSHWVLYGTTGYDFLNQLNQVFISPSGLAHLTGFYKYVIEEHKSIEQVKKECLKLVINTLFHQEFEALCRDLHTILPDEKEEDINNLLLHFTAAMPVYRLYHDSSSAYSNKKIIQHIQNEIRVTNKNLLEIFCDLLSSNYSNSFDSKRKKLWNLWRSDWEVFTGPVMAKGFEDTTCYNYNAFLPLNEVGSATQYYSGICGLKRFHEYNEVKQKKWPYSMNTTSTHDTKRSEDVRARLNVLSELSEEWSGHIKNWHNLNLDKKGHKGHLQYPDLNDELLLYQVLISAWPLDNNLDHFKMRMKDFLMKAMRERKVYSNWASPDEVYEEASYYFLKSILKDKQFLDEFLVFQEKVAFYGMLNSLSQIILKITSPGIPDFYQGNEVWRFDLVDPDNRQIINYAHLKSYHSDKPLHELLQTWRDGRIKFNLIKKLLAIRTEHQLVFLKGKYIPLTVNGKNSDHVIAFMKRYKKEWVVVIALRWFTQLLPINCQWSPHSFSDESIQLPGDCFSLIDNKKIPLINSELSIKTSLELYPFTILKNSN